jgi:succinoglycan biosynthesis protein ExoL
MKIAFITSATWHAGMQKRIRALQAEGAMITVFAFERRNYIDRTASNDIVTLGMVENGHYAKRLITYLKAIPRIRFAAQNADVVYAIHLDLLLLGWVACHLLRHPPKLVYEVRDIQLALFGNSLRSRALRWLERRLMRSVYLTVVTSEAYITGYFQQVQGLKSLPYMVIENKLEAQVLPLAQVSTQQPKRLAPDVLRIGYFGMLRCPYSWEVLKRAAREGQGRIRVYVRGIPQELPHLEEEARSTPFVEYGGPFKSPQDLPYIYGQVDMVWGAHCHAEPNLLWARANRFYEACLFKKPLFTQIGSQDARIVEELGLGPCIDLTDPEKAVQRILHIAPEEIAQWGNNLCALPQDMYIYTDEHQKLIRLLS